MNKKTIYIASSWKNQHAVEMLTDLLEEHGHEVLCFVRHSAQEHDFPDFEEWVNTDRAMTCFDYDSRGASTSDAVVYISPSGTDAWAEVGAAWASNVPIVGLWAKGEQAGLMRHMIGQWFTDYKELLIGIDSLLSATRQVP